MSSITAKVARGLWVLVALSLCVLCGYVSFLLLSPQAATADTPHREIRVSGAVCANGVYNLTYNLYVNNTFSTMFGIVRYNGNVNPHLSTACQRDNIGNPCSSGWYQNNLTSTEIMDNLRTEYNVE